MVAACAAAAAPGSAATLPLSGTLDVGDAGAGAVTWTASEVNGLAGASVAGIGDFDGDGRPDVAVSEPKRDTDGRKDGGVVYVLTDPRRGGSLDAGGAAIVIRGAQ